MKHVCLVFRNPVKAFFSIEKVFSVVKPGLEKKFRITEARLPITRVTLTGIIRNILFARKQKADVYHITGDVHYAAMAFPSGKTVLTIHDCVFLFQSSGIKRQLLKYLFLTWPVKHSRLITTISEATKRDIIKFTGCSAEKIIVIPNPLPENVTPSSHEFRNDEPVLLFIGTTENKNLRRVIPALKGIPCVLHIIGVVPEGEIAVLNKHAIKWKNDYYLTEQQLADKYAEADIVLFPSLFEGFGLPILEGQKAGRPVITSNLEPMKTVAGDGALLVDPNSIHSIREGVLTMIHNSTLRAGLISNGFENIKRFDPEKISEQYAEVYNRILNN